MGRVAVIGEGWVGKSMIEMFPDAVVHDEPKIKERYPDLVEGVHRYEAAIAAGRMAVSACEVAFVCVPTPNRNITKNPRHEDFDGSLDSSIVEEVVDWCDSEVIVIRSTVNPGDADRLKEKTGKRIVSQPEYLGETTAHPMLDQGDRPFMILGGDPKDRRKVIETYQEVYNANTNIRQVSNLEAEVIKLSENRAIAFKVAQAQELYDACEAAGVDYYTVREAVYSDDPRFNLWFTFVYPEKRGMDSKCIPKDVYAWAAWAESLGTEPMITNALLAKNKGWLIHNQLEEIERGIRRHTE
jgi:UDPglucose 6-dehydrogenase